MAVVDRRAARLSVFEDRQVEVASAQDGRVGGCITVFGPGERELTIAVHDPDARERMSVLDQIGQAEVVQLAYGTGSEDVAAGFRAREDATLDDDDVMTACSEPRGSSTTRWSATDDEHVGGRSGCGAGRSGDQGSASGAWPSAGFVPTTKVPSSWSATLSKVIEPSSRPTHAGASGLHHFSYSSR